MRSLSEAVEDLLGKAPGVAFAASVSVDSEQARLNGRAHGPGQKRDSGAWRLSKIASVMRTVGYNALHTFA